MFPGKQSAFRRSKGSAPGLSFIGADAVISGDFATSAHVHIDGRIDGTVRCARLCQSESGTINGDIVAEEARISGLVDGAVRAGTVAIEATARVTGDISYDTISIAPGARIEGRLARREALGTEAAVLISPADPVARSEAREEGLLPLGGHRTGRRTA